MGSPDPWGWCVVLALGFWLLCQLHLTIPSAPFFDEIHYLPPALAYLEGTRFLNPEHPPFGKLLIAGGIGLFGDTPFGWRIASSLAGSVTLFAGMRAMWFATCHRFATLAYGLLLATGFLLFVQARIAMLDIFMLAFVGIAMWQAAAAMREPEHGRMRLIACGCALGLAIACKWNAAAVAPVPGLAFLVLRWQAGRRRLLFSRRGAPVPGISLLEAAIWLGIMPLLVYAATYIPGYWLLDEPIPRDFVAQHQDMMRLQQAVLMPHTYQSNWREWIVNLRPIWYLYEHADGAQRGVLLIGNPLTMLLGLPALAWCAWASLARHNGAALAIAILYAVTLGFWVIAAKPVQFYYHYLLPASVLLGGLALACDALWQRGWRWLAILPPLGSVILFVHFFPVLSAAPLDGPRGFEEWMWLDSWR